ncbi:hypothetical protein QBC35DRAFT_495607 [Podospora australis]|uniref:Heterokaryon incompatibility domain-containing protein n=1 Tax=Podospora australis TaxID=1536484 RepID=A0AAN6WW77_9PEZI|nr:hypothetical protein QBC35DRAFT_495607 [Podospora australis]
MDFLPHPVSGVEPLDIPFVADTPFVFGTDFWDFPKLHGYGDQWASLPAPRLASLAQSWLYFGTIAEFLGRPIDYREFQVSRSVSARPLLPLLNDWLSSHTILPKDPAAAAAPGLGGEEGITRESQKRILYEHAKFLDDVVDLAEDFDKVSQSHVKPIPTIVLSIKVLCTTLRSVLWDLVQIDTPGIPLPWPWPRHEKVAVLDSEGNPDITPSAKLMLDVLRLRGWCPFFARKVLASYNYAIAYYFTRLFRLFSPDVNHDACTFDECVASNADIFSYVPKHIRYGCQCQPLSVPMDQVRAIIEDGGVPLVRLRGSLKKGIRLELTRMTARTRYVVVSHVWSDGIGNANANAMPECQLRRLFVHLSKLKPRKKTDDLGSDFNLLNSVDTGFQPATRRRPRYFWIDALCMPPAGTTVLRIRAINRLPAVYQAADRVLVLDPALEKISIADSDTLEQCARLSVSPWISRCWTFQEAALASVVEVQGADDTFNALQPRLKQPSAVPPPQTQKQSSWKDAITHPIDWVKETWSGQPHKDSMQLVSGGSTEGVGMDISLAMVASLTRCLNREFRSAFANGVKPNRARHGRDTLAPDFCTLFVQVWNQLSERSTTIPGDKHLIIANLLGFNTEPIMRLNKSAERMALILRSMDGIPVSLFFNMHGPRQKPTKHHWDRWVPLYPSRQKLTFGSVYTNLRNSDKKGDLYLPNNTVSREKVGVLVCTGPPDPGSSSTFTLQNTKTGDQYSITIHREDADDAFATPDIGPYCIAIQLDNPMVKKQDGDVVGLALRPPKSYPGALFRVRRVVTKVRKLYCPNLEAEYEKSFELVEEDEYARGKGPDASSGKRSTDYVAEGNIGSAFARYQRGLLRTVYDCPLTVTCLPNLHEPISPSFRRNKEEEASGPTLAAQSLPETWQVVIEREPPTYPFPLPTRPSFAEAMTPVTAHLSVTALDGLVASGCVGFGIAICATMFSLLAPLAKAAIIAKLLLHSLFLIQMFVFAGVEVRLIWNILHLSLVAIYTVSRVSSGHVFVLDWAFIAWSFVGHLIDFVARLVIQGIVVPALFEQYLASFDADVFETKGGGTGKKGLKRWWERVKVRYWFSRRPKVWVPRQRQQLQPTAKNKNNGNYQYQENNNRMSDQDGLLPDDMDMEMGHHQYYDGGNGGGRAVEVHLLENLKGGGSSGVHEMGAAPSTNPATSSTPLSFGQQQQLSTSFGHHYPNPNPFGDTAAPIVTVTPASASGLMAASGVQGAQRLYDGYGYGYGYGGQQQPQEGGDLDRRNSYGNDYDTQQTHWDHGYGYDHGHGHGRLL